eukprot:scaffold6722_cov173-Amphora_coffeaeformis.AAC.2
MERDASIFKTRATRFTHLVVLGQTPQVGGLHIQQVTGSCLSYIHHDILFSAVATICCSSSSKVTNPSWLFRCCLVSQTNVVFAAVVCVAVEKRPDFPSESSEQSPTKMKKRSAGPQSMLLYETAV